MSDNIQITTFDSKVAFKFGAVFLDLWQGLKMWRVWLALSWQEFKATYRRSLLGVLWVLGSFAGYVFVKLIIFSSLIPVADATSYNAFLTIGLYVWIYLVMVVSSGPVTFVSAGGWIRSEALPLSLYVFKDIMRELYNFGLTLFVVIAALVYIEFLPKAQSAYAIFAVLFYVVNAIWIKVFFGILGARFRDVGHLVRAITLPMMFLTPVFWLPEQMSELMNYLWWNPFYHYLEIFRAPIVDGIFPVASWTYVLILFVVGWIASIILFARFSRRIVFWL